MTEPASLDSEDVNTTGGNTDPHGAHHARPTKEARIHKRRRVDIAAIFTPRGNSTSNSTHSGTSTPSSTLTSCVVPAITPLSLGNTLAQETTPHGSASDDEPTSPSALIRQSGAPALAGFVGILSSQLQLTPENRSSLHDFVKLETERKLTTIQAGILYLSGQLGAVLESNQSTRKEIGRLESLCNTNWEPSKEAKMYIGRHARKLFISNPPNFSSWIWKKLVAYVKKSEQQLSVVGYETNVRISSKVNKVITDKTNNARSLLASRLRTSLKRLQPLTQLSQTLARIWLGKDGIAGVSKSLLAQVALLRIEDMVLFIKPEENGSLWAIAEKKIKHYEVEKKLGRDCTTLEWISCMDNIILDEEHRFTQFKQYIDANPESEVAIAERAEMDKRKDGDNDDDDSDENNDENEDENGDVEGV